MIYVSSLCFINEAKLQHEVFSYQHWMTSDMASEACVTLTKAYVTGTWRLLILSVHLITICYFSYNSCGYFHKSTWQLEFTRFYICTRPHSSTPSHILCAYALFTVHTLFKGWGLSLSNRSSIRRWRTYNYERKHTFR